MNPKATITVFVLALALLVAGELFIPHDKPDPLNPFIGLSSDAQIYVGLVMGETSNEIIDIPPRAHVRYRLLVPMIARTLPLRAPEALRAITYASLFTTYFLCMLICLKLGIGLYASAAGLLTIFCSSVNLYNYNNPYMIDAFSMMILSFLLYFLLFAKYAMFGIFMILGLLTRETFLYVAPVWAARDWRKALWLCLIAAGVFLLPRVFSPPGEPFLKILFSQIDYVSSNRSMFLLARSILGSWKAIWLLAPLGILLFDRDRFRILLSMNCFLFLGAFISSVMATDVPRMFSMMFPALFLGVAVFYDRLLSRGLNREVIVFCVFAIANGLIAWPNVLIGANSPLVENSNARVVLFVLQAGFLIYVIDKMKTPLREAISTNLSPILHPGRQTGV